MIKVLLKSVGYKCFINTFSDTEMRMGITVVVFPADYVVVKDKHYL